MMRETNHIGVRCWSRLRARDPATWTDPQRISGKSSGTSVRIGPRVVLGNVEPGARVESAGNIVIVGGLYGSAHAGMGGDHSAFISAITMRPKKMLIGKD